MKEKEKREGNGWEVLEKRGGRSEGSEEERSESKRNGERPQRASDEKGGLPRSGGGAPDATEAVQRRL